MKGTQDGVFLGFPPTGKKIEVNAMNFYRISNGQIIEEYEVISENAAIKSGIFFDF